MAKKLGTVLSIAVFVVILFVIYNVTHKSNKVGPQLRIDVPEAKARRFGLIIDVRTPKERDTLGFYPNSIPISINKLQTEVPLDISSKNTWILVYSNGDSRAQMGAEILYRMGYKNVRYITQTYLSLMPGSQ
jgi:rhodanese-related sulfurtransferase